MAAEVIEIAVVMAGLVVVLIVVAGKMPVELSVEGVCAAEQLDGLQPVRVA